ncbi:Gfo/Idh/MocA family oxidoreductase [Micromonospora chokoriensis]
MTALRVGLVGFGWVNREVWLPRLLRRGDCEVVAVHDPALAGSPSGLPRPVAVATGLPDLLARGLNLVVVAVPNHLHEPIAGAVLDSGTTALVEKPVCLTPQQLERLVRRAVTAGTGLQVSRPARHREDVRRVRALARELCTGPLRIRAEWLRSAGIPRPGSWFTSRAQAGGGALLDLGSHLAEAVQPMLAAGAPSALTARLVESGAEAPGGYAGWRGDMAGAVGTIDVEVEGEFHATWADGSSLFLRAAWVSDVPHDITRIEVQGTGRDGAPCRIRLVTTFGFSPHRVARPILRVEVAGRVTERPTTTTLGLEYDAQLDAAIELACGRAPWQAELRETAHVVALLDEAYVAAGRPLTAETAGASAC